MDGMNDVNIKSEAVCNKKNSLKQPMDCEKS